MEILTDANEIKSIIVNAEVAVSRGVNYAIDTLW